MTRSLSNTLPLPTEPSICCRADGDPPKAVPPFAGETDTETMPDGSSYRSRYSFRVF